jgi:hypothetical protein
MKTSIRAQTNSEWAPLESRIDFLLDKANRLKHSQELPNTYMYRETEKAQKIFRAGPGGFELVRTLEKTDEKEIAHSLDPMKYLTETILELSAVEDAQAILSGVPKAMKKEDGTVSLIESGEGPSRFG